MKAGKLLTIAAALLLVTGVVTSCDNTPTTSVVDGVTAEHLAGAKDYLKDLYKDTHAAGTSTTATYNLVSKVAYQNVSFDVSWKVEIHEGGLSEAVKVGEKGEKYTTIEVKYDAEYTTKDTTYDLVATLTSGNQTGEVKFADLKVPTFKALTIAEFLELGDTNNPAAIQGVVSAVNSLTDKNSFTLTDATGSIFCYDKNLQLTLGDEVIITGTYSLYSNKFPQLAKPSLVKVVASNKLDSIASTMTTYTISEIKAGLEGFNADNKSLSTKYLKITGGIVASNNGNACLKVNYLDASYVVNIYYHSGSDLVKNHLADEVSVIGVVRGIASGNITLQVQSHEVTKDNEPPVAVAEPEVEHTTITALATTKPTEDSKKIYVVEGTFTEKDGGAGEYGNGTISDGTNTLEVYGLASSKEAANVKWDEYAASYSYKNPKDFATTGIKSGDKVKLGMLYASKYDNYSTFVWTEEAATVTSIADFLAAKDETNASTIQATVTSYSNNGYTLTDATGTVFCYSKTAITGLELGNEVVLEGKYKENYKFPQITSVTVKSTVATGKDVATVSGTATKVAASDLQSAAAASDHTSLIATYAGKYLELTGGYVTKSGNYYGVSLTATDSYKINLYGTVDEALVGQEVVVKGYLNGTNSSKGTVNFQIQSIAAK